MHAFFAVAKLLVCLPCHCVDRDRCRVWTYWTWRCKAWTCKSKWVVNVTNQKHQHRWTSLLSRTSP